MLEKVSNYSQSFYHNKIECICHILNVKKAIALTCTCVEDFEFALTLRQDLEAGHALDLFLAVDEGRINIDQNGNAQQRFQ